MILYLIKSTLCLVLMLVIYLLFLEKEKMHRFNRFYLLFSIVFSVLVPFIMIEVNVPEATTEVYSKATSVPIVPYINHNTIVTTIQQAIPERSISFELIFLWAYFLIVTGFLLRFARNIYLILSKISENEIIAYEGAKLVLLKEEVGSHTFLNNIFISASQYNYQVIEKEVLAHELAHVHQKHSLDILFIELAQIFLWFNPILILYKRAIETNHEFLADEAVILTYNDAANYQLILLDKISLFSNIPLTNSFNYMITKKRFTMMTKAINQKRALLKKITIAPLLFCAVFLFSTKIDAKNEFKLPVKRLIQAENLPSGDLVKKSKISLKASVPNPFPELYAPELGIPAVEDTEIYSENPTEIAAKIENNSEFPLLKADVSEKAVARDSVFFNNGLSISDVGIVLFINRNTSRQQLSNYQTLLAKKNITLTISSSKYSGDKLEFIRIKVNSKIEGISGAGAYARFKNDKTRIGFFKIYKFDSEQKYKPIFGIGGINPDYLPVIYRKFLQ